MIGMSPTEAELPGRTYHIRRKQELHYSKINRKKPKYKIGQPRTHQHNEGEI